MPTACVEFRCERVNEPTAEPRLHILWETAPALGS